VQTSDKEVHSNIVTFNILESQNECYYILVNVWSQVDRLVRKKTFSSLILTSNAKFKSLNLTYMDMVSWCIPLSHVPRLRTVSRH